MSRQQIINRTYYGKGLPKVSLKGSSGFFMTIDGAEGSGCSTQVRLIRETFERAGYPTMQVGLGASEYIGSELQDLLKNNFICAHTVTLFHATDIADQLEKKIIPALKAGFVVIADRYCLSSIFRAVVRGLPQQWLTDLYSIALKPDLSIVLTGEPEVLAQRCFSKSGALGFWESGRDCFASSDLYDGFLTYQVKQQSVIKRIARQYKATVIDAEKNAEAVYAKILPHIDRIYGKVPRLDI